MVEVGANKGGGTLFLSMLAKWIYSFEPNHSNFEQVSTVAKLCPNVTVYNFACGSNDDSEITLNLSTSGKSGVSSIPKIEGWEYSKTQKAKLVRLDKFNFERIPTCLVIDCEGYECEVLRGAKGLLSSIRAVLIETHVLQNGKSTMSECKKILEEYSTLEIDVEEDSEGLSWLLCKAG